MRCLVGIDLGTTALKGVLVSETGDMVCKAKRLTSYDYSDGGMVEFSAEKYYLIFSSLIKELIKSMPKDANVAAISISGASGNTVLLNEDKMPSCKAISWMDNRDDLLQELFSEKDISEIHDVTGWPFLGIFPLAHLAWLKQNRESAYRSSSHFILNISYIYFRLTNKFVIDYSTATTFYLADQKQKRWHKSFLDSLNIKESMLPELLPSGKMIGSVTDKASSETGLPQNTKVVLGSFDHPAAARGTGVFEIGSVLLSCGTSWVGFYPISDRGVAIKNKMLVDPFMSPEGNWGAMFSLPGVGKTIDSIINLLIEQGTVEEKYECFNGLASLSTVGANGVLIDLDLPVEQLSSVVRDLSNTTKYSNIFRAVMESVAFMIKRKITYFEGQNIPVTELTMVGGASKSRLWTQIIADITGREIVLLNGQDAGAIGSAVMAGIGAGLFDDEKDGFCRIGGDPIVIEPNSSNKKQYQVIYNNIVQ